MFEEHTIYNWRERKFIKGTALPDRCHNVYMEIINNKDKFYDNLNNKYINFVEQEDLDKIKNTMSDKNAMRILPILQEILPHINFCIEEVMQDKTKYYLKNWLNISPRSQRLPPHTHMGTYHGYWVINDTGTQTIYNIDGEDFPVDNFNGNFMFGPADVWHTLTPNNSDAFRISLGFTLFTEEQKEEQQKYPDSIFDSIGVTVE